MKFRLHIDPQCEEEIIIHARENRPIFAQIERMVCEKDERLLGYDGEDIVVLQPQEVCCFVTGGERVFAVTEERRFVIKKRLYQLQEQFGSDFVRINQGCVANLRKIERFKPSIGGALQVVFQGGYEDYVSRRELKQVKERMGM